MKKSESINNLFSEFPPVTLEKWEELIKKDLQGEDYRSKLKWDTLEGVNPLPFYMQENTPSDIADFSHLKTSKEWSKSVPVFGPQTVQANRSIVEAINGGANSSVLKINITESDQTIGGNLSGIQVHTQEDFNVLFKNVDLKNHELIFDSGMASPGLIAMLLNHNTRFKSASFLFDPFTFKSAHGRNPLPEDQIDNMIHQLTGLENIRSLSADGLFYHHSGATIVQELGIVLAIASEYLARVDKSMRASAAESFFVRLSAGPLFFPEIAKFRAIRLLWANLIKAYEINTDLPLFIHAQTTLQNKPVTDSYNNMLRATTETMAAVLGGADSICIMPFDSSFKKPDLFSNRIARNLHHIVSEEAHLDKVSDPSAGSYYLENLTDEIAGSAWDFFKLIEKQGGFSKSIEAGLFQNEINKSKNSKLTAYATRERILTGTNQYPNIDEDLPETDNASEYVSALLYKKENLSVNAENLIPSLKENLKNGATLGDISKSLMDPQKVLYASLEPFRAGEIFDNIRKRTHKYVQKTGKRPSVSLIPVGNQKWSITRASFSSNLLGCAGFQINQPNGFNSVKEARNNAGVSDIYVLCSSDKEYENLVKPFCESFKKSKILILAGNPKANQEKYSNLGIDYFIMQGMDISKLLISIQDRLFGGEELV